LLNIREGQKRRVKSGDLPIIILNQQHGGCALVERSSAFLLFQITKLRLFWLGLFLCPTLGLHAQRDSTRALQTVTVRGFSPERFMGGLKVQRADSALVAGYHFQTLADFLATQAPLHLKSYGSGQLTTVGFRGTSANHTAVLWNGININAPFSASTDFSTVPLAGFDQLSIQYGAAASCVGTDAVGGSILLSSSPNFNKKQTEISLGQRWASFQNYQTQAGVRFAKTLNKNWQLSGKILLYGGQLNNTFPYTERRGYLVEPSETAQKGFIQDLYFRNKKQRQFSVNIWLTDNRLTLAPQSAVSRETTRSQAYRFLANYEIGKTLLRAGFIRDIIDYGKGPNFETDPSHSATDRFILRAEQEIDLLKTKMTARVGAEVVHFRTGVDEYANGLIAENRADFYALLRYQVSQRLLLSVNLRQAFVTRYDPPFTPSVGGEYRIKNTDKQLITLKANAGRSYRVPTLNERYWRTLGNPNIRPESGFNKEIGVEIKQNIAKNLQASGSLTAFHNRMDDWTYWNPERGFRVENLQLVVARGLELQSNVQYRTSKLSAGFFAQYALTRSSQERVYDPTAQDVVGKQLIYVPLHTGSANVFLEINQLKNFEKTRLTVLWQGNSLRYYTFDNSKFIKGHHLLSLWLDTNLQVAKVRSKVQFQADNIFDVLYLNVKRNAMPGRSFAVNFILNF
jgi:vitamin B12 transporter